MKKRTKKDEHIEFQTALLCDAKGLKFEINLFENIAYYNYLGEFRGTVIEELKHRKEKPNLFGSVSAPTQSLVIKTLREDYGIHITNNIHFTETPITNTEYSCNIITETHPHRILKSPRNIKCETTVEAAIVIALNLIGNE